MYIIYVKPADGYTIMLEVLDKGMQKYHYINMPTLNSDKLVAQYMDIERAAKICSTFYTDGEDAAKFVANILAKVYPGQEVCVAKTVHIYQAIVPKVEPEVITKSISEKGVLPT